MNAPAYQPPYKFCNNCKFECEIAANSCKKYGTPLRSSHQIRLLGGVTLAISLVLIVGMTYVIYNLDRSTLNGGRSGSSIIWTVTPAQISLMFGVLYTVLATGVSAFIAGLWHLVIGRRNLTLIWIMFCLTATLFIFSRFLAE